MRCANCDREDEGRLLPEYVDDLIGIGRPVALISSVYESTCSECGEVLRDIPDFDGLVAAISVSRALHPLKLRGEELRFMRKALEVTARDLADVVGVTPETISRWENNREPVPPTSEKLLRFIIAGMLRDKAPGVEFEMREIAEMKIVSVCPDAAKPLMRFERLRMRFMPENRPETHWERILDHAA